MNDEQKPSLNRTSLYQAREPAPAVVPPRRSSKGRSSPKRKRDRSHRAWRTAFRTLVLGTIVGLGLYTGTLYLSYRASLRPVPAPRAPESDAAASDLPRGEVPAVRGRIWALAEEAKQAQATVDEARRMALRGMRQEPIQRLRRQLEKTPNQVMVLHALGNLLLAADEVQEAAHVYMQALRATPESVDMRLHLGQALFLYGDHEGALDAARWVLASEPYRVEAHRIAARAAMELDTPDVALRHVRRILEMKDDDREAWKTLPVIFLRQGEYGRAIFTLNEIMRRDWAGKEDYFNLSVAFALQDQVEDTVDTLSSAALRWDVPSVYRWLSSHEFERVREDARFRALEQQLARNLSAAPTTLRPAAERTEQTMGLLPEPDFRVAPVELRPR